LSYKLYVKRFKIHLHGHPFLLHTSISQEEDCPYKEFVKWTSCARGN
jgi:hypothetical protein